MRNECCVQDDGRLRKRTCGTGSVLRHHQSQVLRVAQCNSVQWLYGIHASRKLGLARVVAVQSKLATHACTAHQRHLKR
jgi:hypothetical protein